MLTWKNAVTTLGQKIRATLKLCQASGEEIIGCLGQEVGYCKIKFRLCEKTERGGTKS